MSIFDPFVDVVTKAADVVTSVIDRTPGFGEVKKFFVENPVVGQIVFTALGTALVSSLANVAIPSVSGMQTVGPVIASVAFAVPGMVFKGESFTKAYVSDVTARTTALIAYVARQKGGEIAEKLPAATEEAKRQFTEPLIQFVKDSGLQAEINRTLSDFARHLGKNVSQLTVNEAKAALDRAGLSPAKLAARKGVRQDVAALGINGIAGLTIYSAGDPSYADYDVMGNPKPGVLDLPGAPLPNVELAQLQENLRTLGYAGVAGALGVGSENAPAIVAAVRDFQAKNDLGVTGKADARTRQLLQTAAGLPRVAAEVRAAPRPVISRELQAIRARGTSASRGFLPQLVTFAFLTSPAWFTLLILPRLRARTGSARRR